MPDVNTYMKIGYNRTPEDKIMHYRYYLPGRLEESHYMDKSPFIMYNIIKGKFNLSEDVDPNAGPESSGIFKGLIRITEKS